MDNPQAFPVPANNYHPEQGVMFPQEGMTLRDYFAAKAMQGMLGSNWNPLTDRALIAEMAYKVADAMLTERAK